MLHLKSTTNAISKLLPRMTHNTITPRRIRSFVLRQGRITQAQEYALNILWPRFGLDSEQPFEQLHAFNREAPLILEIGFGNGESLGEMAAASPERNFIGVEVHKPGVGHLLLKIEEKGLKNIRIYCADAVEVLSKAMPDACLDGLQIFFPDPWHKKRHHKRRLISNDFARLAASKLKPGGILHCATDWEPYAEHMLEVLEGCPSFSNLAGKRLYSPRPDYRPRTKFESRGQRLGHGVWDLLFARNCAANIDL